MTKVIVTEATGRRHELDVRDQVSLMQVAKSAGVAMEGACEGCMACSTCHVIVDREWIDKLPAPSESERDMLDLTYGVTAQSRLSCQIVVAPALDGLSVRLPRETRNMMD